ncbi:MAG: DUF721 domain-containing protein [Syntrophobacteraceae bacterium]|nr:DUF721 domain-containing protein [Desulfobacteraceae bacterium]
MSRSKTPDHESILGPLVIGMLKKIPVFAANPLGDWKELVGEQMARYSQPTSLKKKTLVVTVYDSVWMHHLELNRQALIEKINRLRPEPIVEKMVLRIGEVPEAAPVLNSDYRELEKAARKRLRVPKRKKAPPRELTAEERELIMKLPDKELRSLATKLLKRIPEDDTPAG